MRFWSSCVCSSSSSTRFFFPLGKNLHRWGGFLEGGCAWLACDAVALLAWWSPRPCTPSHGLLLPSPSLTCDEKWRPSFPFQFKQGHRAKMHPISFPKAFQRPSCTPWPCLGPMGVQDNPHSLVLCFLTGVDWALEKSQSCSIPKDFCCSSNACYCISGGHQLHHHSHPCPSPRPYS